MEFSGLLAILFLITVLGCWVGIIVLRHRRLQAERSSRRDALREGP